MARCDSYDKGECTWGACFAEAWVPEDLGDADLWLQRASQRGYVVSGQPTVDAIAVYSDAHLYDASFGHCAVVVAVKNFNSYKVVEMNFSAWNVYDNRWTDRTGLLGFILAPGTQPGQSADSGSGPSPTGNRDRANLGWANLKRIYDQEWPARIVDLRVIRARATSLVHR